METPQEAFRQQCRNHIQESKEDEGPLGQIAEAYRWTTAYKLTIGEPNLAEVFNPSSPNLSGMQDLKKHAYEEMLEDQTSILWKDMRLLKEAADLRCPLFRLPGELRNRICSYALVDPKGVEIRQVADAEGQKMPREKTSAARSLFAVCHLTRYEARGVYYSENIFHYAFIEDDECLAIWLRRIGPEYQKRIPKLVLEIRHDSYSKGRQIWPPLEENRGFKMANIPRLMRVCQQIRQEAMGIYYAENTFHFPVYPLDVQILASWLHRAGVEQVPKIQKIVLEKRHSDNLKWCIRLAEQSYKQGKPRLAGIWLAQCLYEAEKDADRVVAVARQYGLALESMTAPDGAKARDPNGLKLKDLYGLLREHWKGALKRRTDEKVVRAMESVRWN